MEYDIRQCSDQLKINDIFGYNTIIRQEVCA